MLPAAKRLFLAACLSACACLPARAAQASGKGPGPAATAGACASLVQAIPNGANNPEAFLPAAACLRKAEAALGIERLGRTEAIGMSEGVGKAEGAAPRESGRSGAGATPGAGLDSAVAQLKRRLPGAETWYAVNLERLRTRRDVPRLQDLAWLAALRDPAGPEIWREIAESHSLAGDPFRAAMAQLRQAERDSNQSGYIQYQIETLLRSQAEQPAPVLLDSLTALFRHRKAVTAEILETLCMSNRHYPGAFVNTMAWLALKRPPPEVVLERAGRYQASGYFDYAAAILDRSGWKSYPNPWRAMGRTLYLRLRFQLEDWPAIAAETAGAGKGALSDEEEFIAAAAALELGRAKETLSRLERFEAAGESPWGYRAQLLKSRALLSQGRLPEAARTLDHLKRSSRRREGTGPILFWQGWLALQQGRPAAAESLLVLASAYTGDQESQRALEYRYWILLDSGAARVEFFRGLAESPLTAGERIRSLDRVPETSPLWPYARIEKAQILTGQGQRDSARAVLDHASKHSKDGHMGFKAEAMAAFLQEQASGGRAAALARYEDLLIKYQQGVIPEFSRGRIRALK